LRLAVCEMLYIEDIPTGVSINEAVELAKKYATPEDASFINGVLGTVAKKKEL
ncbi:MAG: transcription antitermination factor NusB, partial [Clostridiales bacterium]|nr:transcription antitermination factor NusB [Clostridiales bacterium]